MTTKIPYRMTTITRSDLDVYSTEQVYTKEETEASIADAPLAIIGGAKGVARYTVEGSVLTISLEETGER